jgi:hypothetical protein
MYAVRDCSAYMGQPQGLPVHAHFFNKDKSKNHFAEMFLRTTLCISA